METIKTRWIREWAELGPQGPLGANLFRLTSAAAASHLIYGEQPRCTPDGKRIAFSRLTEDGAENLWVADLEAREIAKLRDNTFWPTTIAYSGFVFFERDLPDGGRELLQLDFTSMTVASVCNISSVPRMETSGEIGCLTADQRYYLGLYSPEYARYQIVRVDLTDGSWKVIHEATEIFNAHMQADPGTNDLMIQHNRGGKIDRDGRVIRSTGPEGATLYVIDIEGGNRRQIPVGKPYGQYGATGHECWAGKSGYLAFTEGNSLEGSVRDGNLRAAKPGDKQSTPITTGYLLGHLSVSQCGRFFVGDAVYLEDIPIVVGSMRTGRSVILCSSRTTSGGRAQYLHTHPYFTTGNRYVIFNSDRSGVPQIYAAEIPQGLLEGLNSTTGIDV